jgi:hypothetical protein
MFAPERNSDSEFSGDDVEGNMAEIREEQN